MELWIASFSRNRLRCLSLFKATKGATLFGLQPMPQENGSENRSITFERPISAHMMAIDGTWRRSCAIKEVTESGATLFVEASIEGLALKEFFLLLSSTGLAYRRCELDGVNGEELAVNFLNRKNKKKGKLTSDVA